MTATLPTRPAVLGLRPGELVRVREAHEIFATLDEHATLDGLPFMPEMLKHCGQVLPVFKRADKTCDGTFRLRRMEDAVHLGNVRCDGAAHGGCQAACLMYWKEAWLERAEPGETTACAPSAPPAALDLDAAEQAFVTDTLLPATVAAPAVDGEAPAFRCQATELPNAATRIGSRELVHYRADVRNWGVRKVARTALVDLFNTFQKANRKLLPRRPLVRGGLYYPFVAGARENGRTPSARLDLRAGDLVRIKSKEEILATLDGANKNRGLSFDVEMVRYCGRTARVRGRIDRLLDEQTGRMIEIGSDCIVLEGVVCKADFHQLCTRSAFPYWREVWLERVEARGAGDAPRTPQPGA